MPAIMMSPVAGSNPVANGSRMAMVAGGPSPGRMPTRVPSRQPTTSHSRLVGVKAACSPDSKPSMAFTCLLQPVGTCRIRSPPQGSFRELHLEQDLEEHVHRGRHQDEGHDRGERTDAFDH